MYRTGDVGRRLPDGTLEFVGRRDGQIKVRGHRVELGELELHLQSHSGVSQAIVVARRVRHDHLELVAYVVMKSGVPPLSVGDMRGRLATMVPEAWIPTYLSVLAAFPLTPHGKVDRAALPDPEVTFEAVAPESAIEHLLCRVWCEVLGLTDVGVESSFFEVGGDSIKAIQVAAELQKLNYRVSLGDVMSLPTIRALAAALQPESATPAIEVSTPSAPLTPIQRWFFSLGAPTPAHYNQAVMLLADGGLDSRAVRRALGALAGQHAALRSVFDSGTAQRALPPETTVPFDVHDLRASTDTAAAIAAVSSTLQRSLDLVHGPVFRAAQFDTPSGAHLLLIAHHLVIDGVSWRVLLDDLALAYRQAAQGDEIHLAPATRSFASWSCQLEAFARSEVLADEVPYWALVQQEAAAHPLPVRPAARHMTANHLHEMRSVWTETETRRLLRDAHRRYSTGMNDLLLAALGGAIGDVFHVPRVGLLLEGHGREESTGGGDVHRTIGWFTSLFPVTLDCTQADLDQSIVRTRDMLRRVPRRGVGFGVLRHLTDRLETTDLPRLRFNYLGQVDAVHGDGLLRRSPHSTGATVSPDTPTADVLSVDALTEGGALAISVTWQSEALPEGLAREVLARFDHHLRAVILHCTELKTAASSPDVDKIRAMLNRR
jgi:non-ribosomal peptide synthase protein (TIGR01720 family)